MGGLSASSCLRTCSISIAPLPVMLGRDPKTSFIPCELWFLRSVRANGQRVHNDLEQVFSTFITKVRIALTKNRIEIIAEELKK